MSTKKELEKTLTEIEFILRQNNDKIDKFNDPNYTLGYISGLIERVNNCERIY